jgi:hypothetical protein
MVRAGTVEVACDRVNNWLFALLWLMLIGGGALVSAQTNVPTLTSLVPNTAQAGTPGLQITVNGVNFNRLTVVRWNGADRTTDFVSTSVLMFNATAADLAAPGTAQVTAFNSGPVGGVSNPLTFTITQPPTPAPILTAINPNSATAGSPGFTLTVTGANFISTTTVRWNGANRPTTFVSATQLTAQIPASDITTPGTASVNVFTPPNAAGVGGGLSTNPLPFTINQPPNPVPTLTSLNPSSATASGVAFALTVTGTNFINTSNVLWNGVNRPTTFISATQLSAQIPATDIANAGTASVNVFNPPNATGAGGGTSNALSFTITLAPAPLPNLTSINPSAANAGGAGFALMATGTNFINTSVVRWNGADRPTTFVSATQLIAQIPAADIANAGTANVLVFNPPNASGGGGTSRALPFTINQAPNPCTHIDQRHAQSFASGTPGVTLTLTGTNFVANSIARWNGADRPTMFVSATQLTVQLPASDLVNTGTASLTVFNLASTSGGGGLSNALTININNPAPVITAVLPNSIVAGSAAFPLTINGNGFITTSVVRWNGAPRPTTFVNGNQLTAQIPATEVPAVGAAQITVANPTPGGGTSNGFAFTITAQPLPPPVLNYVAASAIAQGRAPSAFDTDREKLPPRRARGDWAERNESRVDACARHPGRKCQSAERHDHLRHHQRSQ